MIVRPPYETYPYTCEHLCCPNTASTNALHGIRAILACERGRVDGSRHIGAHMALPRGGVFFPRRMTFPVERNFSGWGASGKQLYHHAKNNRGASGNALSLSVRASTVFDLSSGGTTCLTLLV